MTIRSFPWSTVPVYVQDWSLMVRRFRGNGIFKDIGNQLEVYADSTGLVVKVKDGDAFINGHYVSNDATVSLVIPTPDTTNDRIDSVVIRVNWNTETVSLAILQGTPAAVPSAPALTQNNDVWEFELANVYVAANAVTIEPADVTDKRTYSAEGGGDVTVDMLNNSGDTVNAGDLLVFDTEANIAFTTTTVAQDLRAFGVALDSIAAGAVGRVASIAGSVVTVNCDSAAIERGDFLITSSTKGKAKSAGKYRVPGVFAVALETKEAGSDGAIKAMLHHGFQRAISGTSGWAMGGFTTIDLQNAQKLTMVTGTWANVLGANLPDAKRGCVGIGNTTVAGFTVGGVIGGAYQVAAHKTLFATEATVAVSSANFTANRGLSVLGGLNSQSKGYAYGGYNGTSHLANGQKLLFSTEVMSEVASALSIARRESVGLSDGVYGYIVSGFGGSTWSTACDLLDMATDTCSANAPGNTPAPSGQYAGMNFPATAGYMAFKEGATSLSYKINFAAGNSATVTSKPANNHAAAVGVSDGNSLGWVSGDDASPYSVSDAFDKSTETYSSDPAAALVVGKHYAAHFNNGAY